MHPYLERNLSNNGDPISSMDRIRKDIKAWRKILSSSIEIKIPVRFGERVVYMTTEQFKHHNHIKFL